MRRPAPPLLELTRLDVLAVSAAHPDPAIVLRAVETLLAGELVIYSTDTLYALGARAMDAAAVARLRQAKGREAWKPLPLIVCDPDQARHLCARWPKAAYLLANHLWPGPLTLVLPASDRLPDVVTAGTHTFAARWPDCALAAALAFAVGPIVSTSANQAGAPPPLTCADAVAQIPTASLALDGGPGKPQPSTIVDVCGDAPVLLREGALPFARVRAVLGI